jgi:hypothetical protein
MFRRFFTVLIACSLLTQHVALAQSDQSAPSISNVQVKPVNDTEVTITWDTNENADSLVNYGLQPDYGILRVPVADKKQHSVTLQDLEPGRTYFFRVVSADENGNQGISADYRIQTSGTPRSGEGEGQGQADGQGTSQQTQTTQEIIEQVNQITNPQQLQEILNETVKAIEGITEDLTIVGPPTVIPETTTAIVKWTTDRESSSEVVFAPTDTFDGTNFAYSQSATTGVVTDHQVQLIGLTPFTEYSFKVRSKDTFGITGESRVFTFKTKAAAPDIRNLRVVKVEENAATLAWDTTVPAKALVELSRPKHWQSKFCWSTNARHHTSNASCRPYSRYTICGICDRRKLRRRSY